MNDNDMGGPAFPEHHNGPSGGMTLWDYYAAAALSGLLADPDWPYGGNETASHVGDYADAMLAERNKRLNGASE